MHNKGQITVFIIIGIVIFIVVSIIVVIRSDDSEMNVMKEINLLSNTQNLGVQIESLIDDCANKLLNEAIYHNGRQGGYYYLRNNPTPIKYLDYIIPFYIYENESYMPSIDEIERQLVFYIKDKLPGCVNNFMIFKHTGYNFESNNPNITVDISEDVVVMEVIYPIKATNLEQISVITQDSYLIVEHFSYMNVYSILKEIVSGLKENYGMIPISLLADLADENQFRFGLVDVGPTSTLLYLIFNETVDNGPLYFHSFVFDRKQSIPDEKVIRVYLPEIPLQEAYVGYEYYFNVGALIDEEIYNLSFLDSTELYDIDSITGEIKFNPNLNDIGNHLIEISVKDKNDNIDSTLMNLEIRSNDNLPPEILPIDNYEFEIGNSYSFNISVYDPDNDPVFFLLNCSLHNIEIHPVNGVVSFKPEPGQEGYYNVKVDAIDIYTNRDTAYFNILIKNGQ